MVSKLLQLPPPPSTSPPRKFHLPRLLFLLQFPPLLLNNLAICQLNRHLPGLQLPPPIIPPHLHNSQKANFEVSERSVDVHMACFGRSLNNTFAKICAWPN